MRILIIYGTFVISIILTILLTTVITIKTHKKAPENIFLGKLTDSKEIMNENYFYENLKLVNGIQEDTK